MEKINYENYKMYKQAQIVTHLKKIAITWISWPSAKCILAVSKRAYEIAGIETNTSIICLGSRNGMEPYYFELLGASRALGLDICPTVGLIPNMYSHDFHEVKPEIAGKYGLAYSNSYDHCYSLEKFIKATTTWLHDDSIIILDWSPEDHTSPSGIADCLGIGSNELNEVVEKETGFKLLIELEAWKFISDRIGHYKGLLHKFYCSPSLSYKLNSNSFSMRQKVIDSLKEASDNAMKQLLESNQQVLIEEIEKRYSYNMSFFDQGKAFVLEDVMADINLER